MARASVTAENAAIAAVLVPGTTYYLSLHSADPGMTGASELSGGGYTRVAVVFTAPTAGVESNTAALSVTNAGTVSVPYAAVWSAITGGTYLVGSQLGSPVTAATITFAIGAATFSVS